MGKSVTVREYARLTTSYVTPETLDRATISHEDFDWLCSLNASFSKRGASLVQIDNRQWLRLDNYVGVIETPYGTRIEILPKHTQELDHAQSSRKLLCSMIQAAMDLPIRQVGEADIEIFDAPLSEWVIQQFLRTLDQLIKRGLRFDYVRVQEEQRFLRGQLDFAKQVRQPAGKSHYFRINHDVFIPDRPENRLLKSALLLIGHHTQNSLNWRLAHELLGIMAEIPCSCRVTEDFKRWSSDRLMAHYESIRPWCELVLRQKLPVASTGAWHGISLLFPMEKLFERYVESSLRKSLPRDARLVSHSNRQYLCTYQDKRCFQLRPDLVVTHHSRTWVLDTKWKLINQDCVLSNYEISQNDLYQLFSYGHKYLDGVGQLALIYPMSSNFNVPVGPFQFSENMTLWALPFDLSSKRLLEPFPTLFPQRQ